MKKTLFSFGNWHYYRTLDILNQSTLQIGNVDNIYCYKESDIGTDFYIKYRQHFLDKRGFGYWIWKGYFIKKMLSTANDDDVFLYVDSGNEVLADLTPLFEKCRENVKGVILFENTDGEPNGQIWKNNLWTKADCFNLTGLTSPDYLYGNQINASYILFRKTEFSVKFFNCFADICANYNIISYDG